MNTDFRTIVKLNKAPFEISHEDKLFLIGSCFTENIGDILCQRKFKVFSNPYGILYNPISIFDSIKQILEKKEFGHNDLFHFNERWHSYYHHSDFSSDDNEITLREINKSIQKANAFLKETNVLFITFGSAWAYELNDSGKIVANCHKVPNKEFTKKLLTKEEIVSHYQILIDDLRRLNKNIKIVFTISPVRHWKDGPAENQRSKATLNNAIHQIVDEMDGVYYFPAYEIMMDDLRDYRFYEADMIHPNRQAIEYIWLRFMEVFFNASTQNACTKIKDIMKARQHRPMNSGSNAHRKFIQKLLGAVDEIENEIKGIDFSEEKSFFKSFIEE